jgi:putative redox protein
MSVSVKWLESRQFVGIDSTGHSAVLSSPADGVGIKPSDLLLISLAGCSAYDVVNILEKKRQKLDRLSIEASGEQNPDPPWAFTHIHLIYRVRGDVTKEAVNKAIELSEEKYCSVAATLRSSVELTWEVEFVD